MDEFEFQALARECGLDDFDLDYTGDGYGSVHRQVASDSYQQLENVPGYDDGFDGVAGRNGQSSFPISVLLMH